MSAVGHVIQLAVAPVFLLSGIGAMLAVMTNRLSRIVDHARGKETRLENATGPHVELLRSELRLLSRRASLIYRAITLCTITALLICLVVVSLFVGAFLRIDFAPIVASVFVAGMVSFFFGLLHFLREIFVATRSLRIGPGSAK
jgi:hypothetical protein